MTPNPANIIIGTDSVGPRNVPFCKYYYLAVEECLGRLLQCLPQHRRLRLPSSQNFAPRKRLVNWCSQTYRVCLFLGVVRSLNRRVRWIWSNRISKNYELELRRWWLRIVFVPKLVCRLVSPRDSTSLRSTICWSVPLLKYTFRLEL